MRKQSNQRAAGREGETRRNGDTERGRGGEGDNVGELETPILPSLDGRGWGRVETRDVQHPHPTSPIEGEEFNSPALGEGERLGGVETWGCKQRF
jgi:hypothetical protein